MAYTIVNTGQTYSPVYHPIYRMVDSSAKSNEAFSYFVDLYSGDTNTYYGRFKFPKRPNTGYGLINLAPVLASYIRPNLDVIPASTGFTLAQNYYFNYRLVYGERYTYWDFTDNFYDPSGYVGFTSNTQTHNFVAGDSIIITQDVPFTNGEYEGIKTVLSASTYSIIVSEPWAGSTGVEGGKVRYADGSPISYSGLASGDTCQSFCASFSPEELVNFNGPDWVVGGNGNFSQAYLLMNTPDDFRIRGDAQAFLSTSELGFLVGGNYAGRINVKTYSGSNVLTGSYVVQNYDEFQAGLRWYLVGVGPYNLSNSTYTALSGPPVMFGAVVNRYTIQMERNSIGNPDSSEERSFTIDDRCSKFDRFDLLFMDKKGSWMPFTFDLKRTKSIKTKKDLYLKDGLYEVDGTTISYDTKNAGFEAYNIQQTTKYVVRSQELTEEESEYFSELLSSPFVYWMKGATTWYSVQLEDGDFEILNGDNGLIRYQISFTLSNKNNVPF